VSDVRMLNTPYSSLCTLGPLGLLFHFESNLVLIDQVMECNFQG
jgi:hypothetical protein